VVGELKLQKERKRRRASRFSFNQLFLIKINKLKALDRWHSLICSMAHAFGASKAPKCCPPRLQLDGTSMPLPSVPLMPLVHFL